MTTQRNRRAIVAHPQALLALFAGVLAPLFVFGNLAEDVWAREGFGWDEPLLRTIHARATPTFDAAMIFFTSIGDPLPMLGFVALAFTILLLGQRRGDAFYFAVAVGGAEVLNVVAKLLFQRARPTLWPVLLPEHSYGFPSGHAMGSLAVVAALTILLWRTRWRWLVLVSGGGFVVAVGLSRVYLGVHYPSDILAGWSASLAWVTGVRLLLRLLWPRWGGREVQAPATQEVDPGTADIVVDRTPVAGKAAR